MQHEIETLAREVLRHEKHDQHKDHRHGHR
jgi:hypothetical protein